MDDLRKLIENVAKQNGCSIDYGAVQELLYISKDKLFLENEVKKLCLLEQHITTNIVWEMCETAFKKNQIYTRVLEHDVVGLLRELGDVTETSILGISGLIIKALYDKQLILSLARNEEKTTATISKETNLPIYTIIKAVKHPLHQLKLAKMYMETLVLHSKLKAGLSHGNYPIMIANILESK